MKHALAFAACLGAGSEVATADGGHGSTPVAGTLITEVVPCASLCTESDWDGPLDGTSRFSLIALEDRGAAGANLSTFHGSLVLSTPRGDLIGEDRGLWDLDTGAYIDIYTVTSGTGDYAGATGVIVLSGTLDPVTGHGDSKYRGAITTHRRR